MMKGLLQNFESGFEAIDTWKYEMTDVAAILSHQQPFTRRLAAFISSKRTQTLPGSSGFNRRKHRRDLWRIMRVTCQRKARFTWKVMLNSKIITIEWWATRYLQTILKW
jgi:hypothetical protein